MGKLDSKIAVVSGAGRGIGKAIALKLASEGARVVVNDLDEGPAKETVTAIEAAGGDAVACTGSVTGSGFAERFVQTAVDAYGGLDIIALGNSVLPRGSHDHERISALLTRLSASAEPLIAESAQWALSRIQ